MNRNLKSSLGGPCDQLRNEPDIHKGTVHISKCLICDKTFSNEMVLQSHIKENHFEAEKLLTTKDTTEDVSNPLEDLPEQPTIDTNLENAKCEICGKEEISQAELNKHMELHVIKCDECDSTFTKTDLLDEH